MDQHSPCAVRFLVSPRVLEPVAEEEVAAVQASGEELPAESARGKEARALDQPEVGLECRAAGEERRDGEKELVDEPRRGERPEEGRPRLAQYALVPARAQEVDDCASVDPVAPPAGRPAARCPRAGPRVWLLREPSSGRGRPRAERGARGRSTRSR